MKNATRPANSTRRRIAPPRRSAKASGSLDRGARYNAYIRNSLEFLSLSSFLSPNDFGRAIIRTIFYTRDQKHEKRILPFPRSTSKKSNMIRRLCTELNKKPATQISSINHLTACFQCSKRCGGGMMNRKVICMKANKTVPTSNCDSNTIIFSTENCNDQACEEGIYKEIENNPEELKIRSFGRLIS